MTQSNATSDDPIALLLYGSKTLSPPIPMINAALKKQGVSPDMVEVLIYAKMKGVGEQAEKWAKHHEIKVEEHRVDYGKYGGYYAQKMCHRMMATSLATTPGVVPIAICFWDGLSDGTPDMVARIMMRDVRVFIEKGDPRRISAERRPPPPNWGSDQWILEQVKRKNRK